MFVVVLHAGGRVTVEGVAELCERSLALAKLGVAVPGYAVVGFHAFSPDAFGIARTVKRELAEARSEGEKRGSGDGVKDSEFCVERERNSPGRTEDAENAERNAD
jgi:hypothetical protein